MFPKNSRGADTHASVDLVRGVGIPPTRDERTAITTGDQRMRKPRNWIQPENRHAEIVAVSPVVVLPQVVFLLVEADILGVSRRSPGLNEFCMNELRIDIQEVPFSLLIDETTDVAVSKLLGVSIKYFSNSAKKITSTILCIIEVRHCDAISLEGEIRYA